MTHNLDRYHRQMLLPGIGEEGQKKLLASKVLVLGCGALGTVIANMLARAGVGHLVIVDRDFIEMTNLYNGSSSILCKMDSAVRCLLVYASTD